MTELRRMALEQHIKEQEREQQQEQRHADLMVRRLKQAFNDTFLLNINPTGPRHEVDGLVFTVSGDPRNSTIYLVQSCAGCLHELLVPIVGLGELGEFLESQENEPALCAICTAKIEELHAEPEGDPQFGLDHSEQLIFALGTALRQVILQAEVLEQERVLPSLQGVGAFERPNNSTQE